MIKNVRSALGKNSYDALFNMSKVVKIEVSDYSINVETTSGSMHAFKPSSGEEKSYQNFRKELTQLEGLKVIQ